MGLKSFKRFQKVSNSTSHFKSFKKFQKVSNSTSHFKSHLKGSNKQQMRLETRCAISVQHKAIWFLVEYLCDGQ